MVNKVDWSEWYDMTRLQPPNKLLVEALLYVKNTGKVIDIGGGALRDTRHLLQRGFDVTVIDKNSLLEKEALKIKNKRLHPIVTSFEDFQFPINEYVLALAIQSLSYCDFTHFDRVIKNIKLSLKKGGIFCGQIYDEYGQEPKSLHKTYKTVEEVKEYLKDMEIILFQEEETEKGRTKHWRIYNFIARK
ncbi:MAG: methyltransferase domain-containing protein [Candidatus Pacebacteria bacterium]|nr:methyltransferase domain-containing protein [Candidatus Paceibacterota bacterium]